MKKAKEIPIGGVGIVAGVRVAAMEYHYMGDCGKCCFSSTAGYHLPCPLTKCAARFREDKKHVYFVKIEENEESV